MFWLQLVKKPIVQRTMVFEFQRAQGMRNAFNRVGDRVREILHRIDAALVARVLMTHMANTIQSRIAQIHIRRSHVDFGAE